MINYKDPSNNNDKSVIIHVCARSDSPFLKNIICERNHHFQCVMCMDCLNIYHLGCEGSERMNKEEEGNDKSRM